MNKNKNLVLLVVLLGSVMVAARSDTGKTTGLNNEGPRRDVLVEIVQAFAFNLEADGQAETPRLTHTAHVGHVFDDFGRRSTFGQSYRRTFRREFSQLSAELQQALGVVGLDRPLPLTTERRAAAVNVLRAFASRLKDGPV